MLRLALPLFLIIAAAASGAVAAEGFIAETRDRGRLEAAIDAERPAFVPPEGVTGITVPHHLLAADLIARGFWAASRRQYSRVILISPDHFHRLTSRFATTEQSLDTVFGPIEPDLPAVRALGARGTLFETMADVSYEHGLHSVAPFIRRFFPDAKIVPVIAGIGTTPADWREAVEALAPLVTGDTLIVQSTDYSHYLPLGTAVRRDQESLALIAAEDREGVGGLIQPAHMDSKAGQFIQLALQGERLGGHPVIVANRNSVEYSGPPDSTTSYVVTVYLRDPAAGAVLRYADQTLTYFAGDTLLGRFFTPVLREADAETAIIDTVNRITAGAPLIVNLEGVLLDEPVSGLGAGSHAMMADLAGPILKRLGVVAAGLANNHSFDLADLGFAETERILTSLGIRPLTHGKVADFGTFRLLPINLIKARDYFGPEHYAVDPGFVCDIEAEPPLIAFIHWGEEYTHAPRDKDRAAAAALLDCGVSAIIGAHTHQAATRIESLAGGALQLVFSVGNFLFDQSMPESSGALVEMRVFRQGTVATRLIPLPNLFIAGREARTGAR